MNFTREKSTSNSISTPPTLPKAFNNFFSSALLLGCNARLPGPRSTPNIKDLSHPPSMAPTLIILDDGTLLTVQFGGGKARKAE